MVGAIVGVWQGFWVAYVGIPAFIVTLAGMLIFRGLALMTLQNSNIGPFPDEFRAIGNGFLDKENALGLSIGLPADLNAMALILTAVGILALWFREVSTRRARVKYGQPTEPAVWFLVKNIFYFLHISSTPVDFS